MNYHLKALERHGLVELVEERRKGNVTERVLQATAASYLISPVALASVAPDPHRFSDRFSAFWLLALAGRMVQEVGKLIAGAAAARQKLATFAIDGEITFRYRRGPCRLRRGARRRRHAAGGQVSRRRRCRGRGGTAEAPRSVVALHPALKPPQLKTARQRHAQTHQLRSRTMTDNREFEIVFDTELPGTPERVWEAVTKDTPAWMFPTDQWPAVKTGGGVSAHLVSRMDGPDGWFNQLEHVLEPLDGGRAKLHYVHSGIFADNWDEQYDGASKHTEFYLHTLGQYLKYFDGRPVVFTDVQAPPPRSRRTASCG